MTLEGQINTLKEVLENIINRVDKLEQNQLNTQDAIATIFETLEEMKTEGTS